MSPSLCEIYLQSLEHRQTWSEARESSCISCNNSQRFNSIWDSLSLITDACLGVRLDIDSTSILMTDDRSVSQFERSNVTRANLTVYGVQVLAER